jgi:hypothetical protein
MAFTEAQRTDIRRYCGYPAYGASPEGFAGWRFFQAYGLLEYRLNNLAESEAAVVMRYLCTLHELETAVPAAGANLDTEQASVWTHNPHEVAERARLFDMWRRRLCGFLGVPRGPDLGDGSVQIMV